MSQSPRIIVDGDCYVAGFLLPGHTIELAGWEGWKTAHIVPLWIGSYFIEAAIRILVENPAIVRRISSDPPFLFENSLRRLYLLKLVQDGGKATMPLPVLRIDEEGHTLAACWVPGAGGTDTRPAATGARKQDVLVHWIGEHAQPAITPKRKVALAPPPECAAHVQIGCPANDGSDEQAPENLALPTLFRIIVTSLAEVCPEARIRRTLSYEAISVDILRDWRGYDRIPDRKAGSLKRILGARTLGDGNEKNPRHTFIAVRLNNSAVLLYRWATNPSKEEAWLFFTKAMPAPLNSGHMGRMDGYIGFVGSCIAAAVQKRLAEGETVKERLAGLDAAVDDGPGWLGVAVRESLLLQAAHFEKGLAGLLFQASDPDHKGKEWKTIDEAAWTPERHAHLRGLQPDPADVLKEVEMVPIDIQTAVSYRNQWFIARELLPRNLKKSEGKPEFKKGPLVSWPEGGPERNEALVGAMKDERGSNLTPEQLNNLFTNVAIGWLSDENTDPKKEIPVVHIGNLALVDRREVEDFLSLHQAFVNYDQHRGDRPLNIAVFGPPGAGKSFGVKEVVKEIAKNRPNFSAQTITFNVSQFAGLRDFFGAMHQVRSECLKGKLPVVFLDEFDSTFENRPFGWLKYFLAPMQDAEFTENGTAFKLGSCVLVFAGGVNRSFEEFNGRQRNISFVEAKGPDFISRLRAHLNVRGVNKPEDEADQGRYILRRAIVLHYHLKKRLALLKTKNPLDFALTHPLVAAAFCRVPHFKHGSRSLEAILDMCSLQRGRQLGPSDLPTKAQLEMHVDASLFLSEVYRSPQ